MTDIGSIWRPQLAGGDFLLCRIKRGIPAVVQIHHAAHLVSVDRLADPCDIFLRGCQRLLDQYILFCVCHGHRDIRMGKVRGNDRNRVHFLIRRQVMVVRIYFADAIFVGYGPRSFFIHVADGHRIRKQMLRIDGGMCLAPGSGTYDAHSNLFHFHDYSSSFLSIIVSLLRQSFRPPDASEAPGTI